MKGVFNVGREREEAYWAGGPLRISHTALLNFSSMLMMKWDGVGEGDGMRCKGRRVWWETDVFLFGL